MLPLPNLLAIAVLLVGIPLNLVVTVMLIRKSSEAPTIKVLRERMVVALCVTLVVVAFSLVFWNNDTIPPYVETDVTKIITRCVLLVVAVVPALYWLAIYYRDQER